MPHRRELDIFIGSALREDISSTLSQLVNDSVASRLGKQDPTLWGAAAESEASIRLGWVDLYKASRDIPQQVTTLRRALHDDGIERIVLCGMGGSSLAPEVIAATHGVPLVVLDSTDPEQVRRALGVAPDKTAVVISSKSGTTVETDSQRRAFEEAFTAAGVDAASRMIVVTDPGSQLEESAKADNYRAVFLAEPNVGGRYSAMTAFGLVPTGLAGADTVELLDQAAKIAPDLYEDIETNPALLLGAAMAVPGRDKLLLVDHGSGIDGLGDWVEQLVAESTGKEGKGVLPVIVGPEAPELDTVGDDYLVVRLAGKAPLTPEDHEIVLIGNLGAQMLLWEAATAVAGRVLGIDPFNQPDVESAKKATRGLLDERPDEESPVFSIGDVEVYGAPDVLGDGRHLTSVLSSVLNNVNAETGYIAVMAYLNREIDTAIVQLRDIVAEAAHRPTTFGWGPRFLHSTGQYHKGGPSTGVFIQITAQAENDLTIPDRPFTFGELIAAQAAGDAGVLTERNKPVVRFHITSDRATGINQILLAAMDLNQTS